MANTFELIASSTVGSGGAASIDFSSIPATYTDLRVVASVRTNRAPDSDAIKMRFNGSSTSFTGKVLYGSGSGIASFAGTTDGIGNAYVPSAYNTANTFGNTEFYIPNYAGSTNKSVSVDSVGENNATYAEMDMIAGLWSNTAAITSISIVPNVGTLLLQYSTAFLYGIKNS
jgi:hypothetical protein